MRPAGLSAYRGGMRTLPLLAAALVAATSLSALSPADAQDAKADLVLRGATVHTLDPARPTAEAVAIRGSTIAAVGSAREIARWIGDDTRVVDLAERGPGMAVYPGFADSHMHLIGHGRALVEVDLMGTASYDEVIERVVAQAARQPEHTWLVGRGWDQNDWPEARFPHHAALSAAVPNHPVVLTRVDGHALLANALAMTASQARFGELAWGEDGGRVIVDDQGPTGVFVDNAMSLVYGVVPPPTQTTLRNAVALAIDDLHGHGITSIHDAGIGASAVELYADMARDDAFDLRVHVLLAGGDPTLTRILRGEGGPFPTDDYTGHGRLAVRSIKLSIDGALGSRGAAMLDDYTDEADNDGLLLITPEEVEDTARRALRHGFQLCVHAIGDRGNREVLDAFERALADVPVGERPVASPRLRIEHAQILHPDDVPRFAALGVIPSMQALHQTSDMPWAGVRVGDDRLTGAYAWRTLLETGVIIPGGSDAPVEVPSVIHAFHAAVTRTDTRGEPDGGWFPEQVMTRDEALRHVTLWPAIAAFDEDRLGSIEVGKLADLVVTDGDLMTLPVEWLPRVQVAMTVFDGEVVHDTDRASLAVRRENDQVAPAYEP